MNHDSFDLCWLNFINIEQLIINIIETFWELARPTLLKHKVKLVSVVVSDANQVVVVADMFREWKFTILYTFTWFIRVRIPSFEIFS
jgi:hypothetical protein